MTINQLKYFQTVCRFMSFTKASEVLFVSQPAISSAIRDFEQEFNVKLFNRQNNNLSLTETGKWLLEKCGSALREFENIETQLQMLSSQDNHLRIGVAPMIGNYYFFNVLNSFMKQYASARSEIIEAGSLKLREEVMHGSVDIGVVILNDFISDKVNTLKIFDSELVLCVSKNHRFSGKKYITFEDLSNEKIVLLKEDSYQNTLIRSKFKEANSELNLFFNGNQLNSVKKMLYQEDCCAFLFDKVVEDDANLVAISFKEPLMLCVGLIWLKNQKPNANMQNFISYVRQNSSM